MSVPVTSLIDYCCNIAILCAQGICTLLYHEPARGACANVGVEHPGLAGISSASIATSRLVETNRRNIAAIEIVVVTCGINHAGTNLSAACGDEGET